jgi:phosphatidate cytidylyltransferase
LTNFFVRTLTGIWIVIFVIGGLWIHPVSFYLTLLIMLIGTIYEYYLMIRNTGIRPQVIPGIATGITIYTLSTLIAAGIIPKSTYLIIIPMISVIMVIELYRKQDRPFDSLAHTFFPVIYTVLPFSMFPYLAFNISGIDTLLSHSHILFSPGIILGFFLILWSNDTGAYLAGVTFGKHKLFERISPKKTWEGFFGGLLLAVAVAWFLSGKLGVVNATGWIILSIIISVSGTYGDLIESMLKRSIGVKDSGSVMPGHGGFLDRFDSVIIAFPLVYLYITVFGQMTGLN